MWSVISNTTVHVASDRNQYFKIRLRKLRNSQGHSLPQPRISAKEHRPFSFEKILTKLHRSAKWIENRECLQVYHSNCAHNLRQNVSMKTDSCKYGCMQEVCISLNIFVTSWMYGKSTGVELKTSSIYIGPMTLCFSQTETDRGFYGDVCDSFSGCWQSSGMLPLSRVI